jgi:GWxTD domain-containing protein
MVRKSLLLLATALLAFPLLAADLGKYKEWGASPAAYLLTATERAEWATLQSEAVAEAFVKKFTEARGGEKFTTELNKRIQIADKYLTVGTTKGSASTRGKVVIVLGPPKGMTVTDKAGESGRSAALPAGGSGELTIGGGTSVSEMTDVAQRGGMAGAENVKIYTFTYDHVTVPVEVTAGTGKDRIADKKARIDFDRVIEEAAKASIAVK